MKRMKNNIIIILVFMILIFFITSNDQLESWIKFKLMEFPQKDSNTLNNYFIINQWYADTNGNFSDKIKFSEKENNLFHEIPTRNSFYSINEDNRLKIYDRKNNSIRKMLYEIDLNSIIFNEEIAKDMNRDKEKVNNNIDKYNEDDYCFSFLFHEKNQFDNLLRMTICPIEFNDSLKIKNFLNFKNSIIRILINYNSKSSNLEIFEKLRFKSSNEKNLNLNMNSISNRMKEKNAFQKQFSLLPNSPIINVVSVSSPGPNPILSKMITSIPFQSIVNFDTFDRNNLNNISINDFSHTIKSFDCSSKACFFYFLKSSSLDQVKTLSISNSLITQNENMIPVKLTLNNSHLIVRLSDNDEILRFKLTEIGTIQRNQINIKCFEITDIIENKYNFCQMDNLVGCNTEIWMQDILNYKKNCDSNLTLMDNSLNKILSPDNSQLNLNKNLNKEINHNNINNSNNQKEEKKAFEKNHEIKKKRKINTKKNHYYDNYNDEYIETNIDRETYLKWDNHTVSDKESNISNHAENNIPNNQNREKDKSIKKDSVKNTDIKRENKYVENVQGKMNDTLNTTENHKKDKDDSKDVDYSGNRKLQDKIISNKENAKIDKYSNKTNEINETHKTHKFRPKSDKIKKRIKNEKSLGNVVKQELISNKNNALDNFFQTTTNFLSKKNMILSNDNNLERYSQRNNNQMNNGISNNQYSNFNNKNDINPFLIYPQDNINNMNKVNPYNTNSYPNNGFNNNNLQNNNNGRGTNYYQNTNTPFINNNQFNYAKPNNINDYNGYNNKQNRNSHNGVNNQNFNSNSNRFNNNNIGNDDQNYSLLNLDENDRKIFDRTLKYYFGLMQQSNSKNNNNPTVNSNNNPIINQNNNPIIDPNNQIGSSTNLKNDNININDNKKLDLIIDYINQNLQANQKKKEDSLDKKLIKMIDHENKREENLQTVIKTLFSQTPSCQPPCIQSCCNNIINTCCDNKINNFNSNNRDKPNENNDISDKLKNNIENYINNILINNKKINGNQKPIGEGDERSVIIVLNDTNNPNNIINDKNLTDNNNGKRNSNSNQGGNNNQNQGGNNIPNRGDNNNQNQGGNNNPNVEGLSNPNKNKGNNIQKNESNFK